MNERDGLEIHMEKEITLNSVVSTIFCLDYCSSVSIIQRINENTIQTLRLNAFNSLDNWRSNFV